MPEPLLHDKASVSRILVIKTAALGDVLRTTSILPGLRARYPQAAVTWLTAPAALPLVVRHPLVDETVTVDLQRPAEVAAVQARFLAQTWLRVLSLDDERPLCELASALPSSQTSGAIARPDGTLDYTDDVAPWFDMGLLSRLGKARADQLKIENQRTHPAIFADMLGITQGRPELPLPPSALVGGAAFAMQHALRAYGAVVGLNTGAGGRWRSKGLPVVRVVELVAALQRARPALTFLLLGGPEEKERNRAIADGVAALAPRPRFIDAGTEHALLEFAALIDYCDLLVTSDSLALHIALARRRPVVAFFAPTSAAEIELYGLGEKVASTAPDYCSYRPDADNSTITAERLAAACLRVLG
jgi:heptosyltransferase-2